jgi:hypothetical protein
MIVPRLFAAPFLAGLALLASACSDSNANESPISEGEAAALDEAAKMLDEKRLPEGVIPDPQAPVPAQAPTKTTEEPAR